MAAHALAAGRARVPHGRRGRGRRCARSWPARPRPGQIGGFLMALRTKGETADELEGLARTMLEFATPVRSAGPVVDVVGTGGDRSGTFNISTVSAIVVAGAGVPVAKHGNRAASSHCGSADVLEALGVKIDLDAAGVERCLTEAGHRLPLRPVFHPSMAHAGPVRRELRVPTVFNFLGPLTNPARPFAQAVGVLRCPHAAADGRGPRPPRHPREALPRRGRPRRAHHHRPLDRLRRPRRPGPRDPPRPRRPRPRPRHPRRPPRRRRRDLGRDRPLDPRRGARPQTRRRPAERRRRPRSRREGRHPRQTASRSPPRASTPAGRPRRRSSAWVGAPRRRAGSISAR